jgi:DNA-binding NtrC family response regulator
MTLSSQGILEPTTSVLIIDDSQQYGAVLRKILTHAFGYTQINHLLTTEAALEELTKNPSNYQLLFIDFRFPSGFSGGDLLTQLKERNLLQDKVAFLISSEPTVQNVKQAVQAGAFGIVAKPFDREELRRQLEKADRAVRVKDGLAF